MRILNFILLFLFLFSLGCKEGRENFLDSEVKKKDFILCDFDKISICNFKIQEKEKIIFEGTLDLSPRPVRVMKEIQFTLQLNSFDFQPEEILLDLTMPEMYMGENQVKLIPVKENQYVGKGIFPECSSGFKRWNIEIIFSKKYSTNIQFDIQK